MGIGKWTANRLVAMLADGGLATKLAELSRELVPPRERLLASVREQYQKGRLVLVLGAGVSLDNGLPGWSTLLQKLVVKTIQDSPEQAELVAKAFTELFSPNPLISARYLARHFAKSAPADPLAFTREIRDTLYEGIEADRQTALMKELCKLCVAAGKSPDLDCVITYNYDDLLEAYIEKLDLNLPFCSIYDTGMNPGEKELAIYHVHGFLPRARPLDLRNQVTLSDDIYHRQYADTYGWSNLVQVNKFKDAACLFVGVSFTDPNLRRLLDIARAQRGDPENTIRHYGFKKRYDPAAIRRRLEAEFKDKLPKAPRPEEAEARLVEMINVLVKLMEGFEEIDASSLGVGLLWVEEFNEIPDLLRQIRLGVAPGRPAEPTASQPSPTVSR